MNVLSIETAIGNGSISIRKATNEIISIVGDGESLRAGSLMQSIGLLLERSELDRKNLDLIVASNGPGSFTGIRIGRSTALGLCRALNIRCIGVSLFAAIESHFGGQKGAAVALPMGRNDLAWRYVSQIGETVEQASDYSDLAEFAKRTPDLEVIAPPAIIQKLKDTIPAKWFTLIEPPLAQLLSTESIVATSAAQDQPIYLRHNQRGNDLF